MLPNKNESEDDVKVAPKPKLQVGHHPIQRKKGKSNPHCSCWSSWSLPVAGQLRPSPTKLPDTTSQEVCPERGVGSLLHMPKVLKSCSHSERSNISPGQISGWFGAEIILTKKKHRKTTWHSVFGDMWIHVTSPISSRPSSKKCGFSQPLQTTKAVPKPRARTAPPLQALFACGWAHSFPTRLGFLLGKELAPKMAL